MPKAVVLSYADIEAAGACADALALVPQWYPEGFPLTAEAIDRLMAHDWTWGQWLVTSPLCPRSLSDAYRAQVKPLDEAHWAQWESLDWAQWESLSDAYRAQVKLLDGAHWAQRKSLVRATLLAWGGQGDA